MTRREALARWLWTRDGMPAASWDTGARIIACDKGGRVPVAEARAEMHKLYLAAADDALRVLDGIVPEAAAGPELLAALRRIADPHWNDEDGCDCGRFRGCIPKDCRWAQARAAMKKAGA